MINTGNVVPEITAKEHDPILSAKRVSLASAATIYAVVNTAAAGQASVVLDTGTKWIGLVTTVSGATVYAVVNTAAAGQASVALDTSTAWIGLATTHIGGGTVTAVTTITNVVHVDDNSATLSIDDGAGSITVDGTVTAELSATDNTVLDNIDTSLNNIETAIQLIDGSIIGPGQPTIDSYTHASINLAAGANQVLVSSAASKQIWVYGFGFTVNAAGTVSFQDEDDTAITGVMPIAANSGIVVNPSGNFSMPIWKLATDKDLEIDIVTSELDGWICYSLVSV